MPITTGSRVLRGLTSAGVLLSAAVHLQLWATGVRFVPFIGEAFVVNAVAGLVLGILVLTWWNPLPLLGSVAFGLGTLGAFIASITVGLLGFQEQAAGVPQALAAAGEIAAVVFGIAALIVEHRPASQRVDRHHPHGVLNTSPVHHA
jgi:hypothetical protein